MALRRLVKQAKLVNKNMLMCNRREPYKPRTLDRHAIEDRTKLNQFNYKFAEGTMFVPDESLPPWRRSVITNLKQVPARMNIRGFRIRAVDRQDEPGFPTHLR